MCTSVAIGAANPCPPFKIVLPFLFLEPRKKKEGGECNKNERADKKTRKDQLQSRTVVVLVCMLVGVVFVWVCVRACVLWCIMKKGEEREGGRNW